MSLERKIEELTKAVTLLTQALGAGSPGLVVQDSAQVDEVAAKEAEIQKSEPTATHDDLKQTCLKVARAGKKAEVKEVLNQYGAVKAVDVPLDSIVECIDKLEAL
ncbi:coil containing protein [Vibrio phage LP.1]|nr:coil containing protein [Vibrio phage LP.1]